MAKVLALPRVLAAVSAVGFAVVVYVYVTLPDVRSLATVNPQTTAFMELRAAQAAHEGRSIRHAHRWVPYSRISANLKRAVLVAEDSAFWDHEGIDLEQIRESIRIGLKRGQAVRGASTITQQLAKNLYLSPSRNPVRKLRELIITRRLEAGLSKVRIFEIYLNVIEWGDGIWGAEAAARAYFGVSASALSSEQAALLAGAIINPRTLSPARPPARLLRRQRIILARMAGYAPPVAAPAGSVAKRSESASTRFSPDVEDGVAEGSGPTDQAPAAAPPEEIQSPAPAAVEPPAEPPA